MKIIQLQSENVKRLRAVTIKPDGSMVVIKGDNGQGKSSVIDSIAYALGGKELLPPEVIRRGEESAQVVLDLGELVVTRKWTSNANSYLEVKSKDGAKYPSPQTMLDGLLGALSFDPLNFMRLEPARQAETLRKLTGLDFSKFEAKRAELFEKRTEVNRAGKELKARLDAIPEPPPGTPEAPVSIDALLAQQSKLQDQKAANDRSRAERVRLEQLTTLAHAAVDRHRKEVDRLERLMTQARAELAAAEQQAIDARASEAEITRVVDQLVDPDTAEIYRQIRSAESTNLAVKARADRAQLAAQVDAKRTQSKKLADEIAAIDTDKADALGKAQFPVPGLGFGGAGLTLNDLPLEQASSAEQLRVSLAMGLALNPKLRVLLIRDGSLLDSKHLAVVAEMAKKADAQVWIERVGKADQVGVLIEDGAVAGAPAKIEEDAA